MNMHTNQFSNFLEDGESIEWIGKAQAFSFFDSVHKKSLITRWVICLFVAVTLPLAYLLSIAQSDAPLMLPLVVILIAAPLFVAVRPFWDARSIKKHLVFAITDQRAITYKGGSDFFAITLDESVPVKFIEKSGGVGDVLFGDAVTRKIHKLRVPTLVPQTFKDDDKPQAGLIFYHVGDVATIKEALAKCTNIQ